MQVGLRTRRDSVLEQGGGDPRGAVAGVGLRCTGFGRLPGLGTRKRTDPSAGAVMERLWKVVFEHVVARLPGGAVGLGGISPGFHGNHGWVARKGGTIGWDEQRGGRLAARIAIVQRHIRYFKVSSSW